MCEFVPAEMTIPLIAVINSSVATSYFSLIAPTLNINAGDIDKFPVIFERTVEYKPLSSASIDLSKLDWDSFETSWDFKRHPLL